MEINLTDVRNVFEDILSGRLTCEEADRWGYSVIQKVEAGEVRFPSVDEKKIWSGIMYLYGVDSKETPNEYLHSLDDIRKALYVKLGAHE